jgi:sterol desaturase/sphingolipid hydroxylase (fatty acid hydroxylase superfamily)
MIRDLALAATDRVVGLLLSPGSILSIWSLTAALLIAAGVALAKRQGRPVSLRAMVRAMFPRHRVFSASARTDLGFTLLSITASTALLGWAVMSHLGIAAAVEAALGRPLSLGLPAWLAVAAMTLALWLAYEFAYWFDHLLKHKIPALWAFHKVHHSAETLSPLTVFRVHPVDSIVFYNIIAVITGFVMGIMHWLVGAGVSPWTIGGANVLMIAGLLTIKHLHHSHAWIAWGGVWGRLILSPAHHQIHHSSAPEHHDRNFGGVIGVFDWLAGTLHIPQTKRQVLTFGVEGLRDPHSLHGAMVQPFADALSQLWVRRVPDDASIPALPASMPDIRPATH